MHAGLMDSRTIAVNLSALQLREPGFPDEVFRSLEESGLAATLLDLEITESALMEPHEIYHIMETLHSAGIKFSIDDFGTGYSSLLYLKRMPIGQLKIDREFILHCMKTITMPRSHGPLLIWPTT
ncbi:MAG: EAL domain-containing protein [Gammaproteobacteria bacterium]|nr:EAL domain-containing protein [Gammaproteobacteria bacterium]